MSTHVSSLSLPRDMRYVFFIFFYVCLLAWEMPWLHVLLTCGMRCCVFAGFESCLAVRLLSCDMRSGVLAAVRS